jgi:type VI secretion system protein ImpA
VALSKLAPRPDEPSRTQAQIGGLLGEASDAAAALRAQTDSALDSLNQIQSLMNRRFSPHLVVDLATLRGMLASIQSVLPAGAAADTAEVQSSDTRGATAPLRRAGGVYSVDTRQDAVRAIELVCAYLERSEPTNPAQLLLRRAARVIDKNFLQLVRELAPDAVKDVARIMGVDPNTVNDQN